MQITQNYALRAKFLAGLQISGEDQEGNLLWMGNAKQWQDSETNEVNFIFEPDYRDFESGHNSLTPDQL